MDDSKLLTLLCPVYGMKGASMCTEMNGLRNFVHTDCARVLHIVCSGGIDHELNLTPNQGLGWVCMCVWRNI